MTDDAQLLSQYAKDGVESAFEELVRRYLPLVYAAALCHVGGNRALAEDAAQTVFIDLARKPSSSQGQELLAGEDCRDAPVQGGPSQEEGRVVGA